MASIIEAVEDIFQDGSALVKFAVYAVPIFFAYRLEVAGNPLYLPLGVLISIILLGFTTECISNVRNDKERVMPGYNIFRLFWRGIKALIAVLPYAIAAGMAAFFTMAFVIKNIITLDAAGIVGAIFIYLLTYGIAAAVVMTAYFLYARRFKISDAYNLKLLSDAFADVFVGLIFFSLKMILLDIVIGGSITYLFWVFADITNNVYIYFLCMMVVFKAAVTGDYFAQMSYEAIEVKENEQ